MPAPRSGEASHGGNVTGWGGWVTVSSGPTGHSSRTGNQSRSRAVGLLIGKSSQYLMAAKNSGKGDERGSDMMTLEEQSAFIESENEPSARAEGVLSSEPVRWGRGPGSPPSAVHGLMGAGSCDFPAPGRRDESPNSLCATDRYSSSCSSTDALSGRQSDPGDDCASVILTCLFCKFSELLLMLPLLCEAALSHHSSTSAQQPPAASDDSGCGLEFDCSALEMCLEAGECLELAMEISEICYR